MPGWNGKGASLGLPGPVQEAAPQCPLALWPGDDQPQPSTRARLPSGGDVSQGQRHPGHTGALGHRFLQGPQFLSAATLIASGVAPDTSALRL